MNARLKPTSPAIAMADAVGAGVGLTVRGVSKSFHARVLTDMGIDVAPGELVALTGPSGAGKTTFCRILAGLERPDTGTLLLGGQDLAAKPAGLRRVAFLFESYALYPHLTVRQNALSPLQAPNGATGQMDLASANRRVDEMLELLEIAQLDGRLPASTFGRTEAAGGTGTRVGAGTGLVPAGRTDLSPRRQAAPQIARRDTPAADGAAGAGDLVDT